MKNVLIYLFLLLLLLSCRRASRGTTVISGYLFEDCSSTPSVGERVKVLTIGADDFLYDDNGTFYEGEIFTDENGRFSLVFDPDFYVEFVEIESQNRSISTKRYSSQIDFGSFYKAKEIRHNVTIKTDSNYTIQDTLFFLLSDFSSKSRMLIGPFYDNQLFSIEPSFPLSSNYYHSKDTLRQNLSWGIGQKNFYKSLLDTNNQIRNIGQSFCGYGEEIIINLN